jgi:hypothetical protein
MMDITPTWEGILPILLRLYGGPERDARQEAFEQLARMAELADAYVAEQKKGDTFEPIGDAADRVVSKLSRG